MSKRVAVLAVNPVNGFGLFQYLEAFYENKIEYKVYAVSDTVDIRTNSGIAIKTDDTIAKGIPTISMLLSFLVVMPYRYLPSMLRRNIMSCCSM